jgi:hypothetical protein
MRHKKNDILKCTLCYVLIKRHFALGCGTKRVFAMTDNRLTLRLLLIRHCEERSNPESSHCYMLLISLPYMGNIGTLNANMLANLLSDKRNK